MKTVHIVEANYMKRGWEFYAAFAESTEACAFAQKYTQGLEPVWKYRVRVYDPRPMARTFKRIK